MKVFAGNWKMNKGPQATTAFFESFLRACEPAADTQILIFPPALSVSAAVAACAGTAIRVGVQNIHWEAEGAYTGEISAAMAREAGAQIALVGHSERRHIFGETDEQVRDKVAAARKAGLAVVACVGETLDERKQGRLEEVIVRQLDAILAGLRSGDAAETILAYEPVWAIGTGVNATPQDASEAHKILRSRAASIFGDARVPILYGGSVKPENAASLLAPPDVDGLLVGGASLDPEGFARICAAG